MVMVTVMVIVIVMVMVTVMVTVIVIVTVMVIVMVMVTVMVTVKIIVMAIEVVIKNGGKIVMIMVIVVGWFLRWALIRGWELNNFSRPYGGRLLRVVFHSENERSHWIKRQYK